MSAWALLLSLNLWLLGGCASAPETGTKSAATAPQTPAATNQSAAQPAKPEPAATEDPFKAAAAKPSAPLEGEGWEPLFNGENLSGWKETPFAGHGEVECRSGLLVLNMGDPFTGVNYTNQFPTMDYEISLDAMRVMGTDFFCGLTVPVGESFCSLIVGGWGGGLVGISSVDGMDASENETTKFAAFESGRWYRIRFRVTEKRLQAWLDADQLVDLDTKDRRLSLRPGDIELSKPIGIAAWQTTAALRNIKMRPVDGPAPRQK